MQENWLESVYAYINEHFESDHLPKIRELVRHPSIAGTGEGILDCAEKVMEYLRDLGCVDVHLEHYVHSPVVSGKLMSKTPNAPTLVLYGMYDVQPPEPLEEWRVPPYEGAIEDVPPYGECVVARGIANSKGPLVCFINAIDSIRKVLGDYPINIWFVIEGEEELGSESMLPFTRKHAEELSKCLGVYLTAARQDENGRPFTTLGNKGILYFEMECRGGDWGGPRNLDVHGMNAAWLSSPVWRLVSALSTMRDKDDNILIEGFYDDVVEPEGIEDELTKEMAAVFDEEMYLKTHLDAKKFMKNLTGEAALRNWLWKPTLNIDGIWAGYTGPATKTVLPYHATCKIDVRLVPNMRADVMLQKIRNHLDKHGFSDITLTMRQGTQWSLVKGDCIPARACIEAMRHSGYPETTVWPIFPGSGPAYMFTDPPVSIPLVDYGLGISGQIHAPNEYFTVKGLRENEMSSAAFLFYLDKFVREEAEK